MSMTCEAPASLYAGVEEAACRVLRIAKLNHRSALLDYSARGDIPAGVVRAVYDQLAANWRACVTPASLAASRQNWRWRVPQLAISEQNTSPEVVLERDIINTCERQGREDWSNQVPVASGVAGRSAERRRAIDLVHQKGPGHFEFIELKVGSDTPLFAAVEIIAHACVWLLTRQAKTGNSSALLAAEKIDVIVLAPDSYYAGLNLGGIQMRLDQELRLLGQTHGVELGFGFGSFAERLAAAPITHGAVATLLENRRRL